MLRGRRPGKGLFVATRGVRVAMSRDMWNEQWERVLWKRKPYPDNFVPDSFLASLSTNRESAASAARRVLTHPPANFRPYTYWSLVQASWTVSLHLAAIFTFVAVFVRLKERLLDPRLLVWMSVLSFISFYILWEIVEASRSKSQRAIDRECPLSISCPSAAHLSQVQKPSSPRY